MQLPSFKRLIKQDYKESDRDLVDRLSVSLNIGIETLYNLANHRISLGDNIQADVRTFEIKVGPTGTPVGGITNLSFTNVITAIGAQVIQAKSSQNAAIYPTAAPFISFTQNGKSIDINNVAGLPANQTFALTVVIWG